ncbi:hypothetical protein GGD62_008329 [Bradyrhizobium sp. ERR14]|nr:hypothetical protein [Bradyrhizobium sp. ERR14]
MRTLSPQPVFPVLHRRRVLPARLPARALGPEPLAQATRRQAGAAAGREPAGGARGRRVAQPGPQAGHGRHHGAAEGHHLSDRCQAAACGHQGDQPPGEKTRRQAAAILLSRGQGRGDDGRALYPCQTVQSASAAVAHPALPARRDHPRHPPQDREAASVGGGVRPPPRLAKPPKSARNSSASAVGSSIPFMPRRWSASAKARPPRLTSSA